MRARIGLALLAFLALTGARNPILVPGVSQDEVYLQQGFTGTNLLLFGALLTPEGTRGGGIYDIVVVFRGPSQSVVVREKQRVAGIWVNANSVDFKALPSFYTVASSRPVDELVDNRTAMMHELGLKRLRLLPDGTTDPARLSRFVTGLIDLRERENLFLQTDSGVTLNEGVLYQARIALPARLSPGNYVAETYAISKGKVVASAMRDVHVRKVGFSEKIADFAEGHGVYYGLLTVFLSVGMGWVAGRYFSLT